MKYLLSIITVTHFSVVLIAQTSFPSGCYYTIEQVMSRSPQDSLLCLVYKHSKDDSKHYGYAITPINSKVKKTDLNGMLAVSNGTDFFINGCIFQLDCRYSRVVEKGDKLYFKSFDANPQDYAAYGIQQIAKIDYYMFDLSDGKVRSTLLRFDSDKQYELSEVCNPESTYDASVLIDKPECLTSSDSILTELTVILKKHFDLSKKETITVRHIVSCKGVPTKMELTIGPMKVLMSQGIVYVYYTKGEEQLAQDLSILFIESVRWIPGRMNNEHIDAWVTWNIAIKKGKVDFDV